MPIFVGSDFFLESVSALGPAIVRVRFSQDPGANCLDTSKYTLTGPTPIYPTQVVLVPDDPQAIDLFLIAPLDPGQWTLAADASLLSVDASPLIEPRALPFAVATLPKPESPSMGAVNDPPADIVRKHLNPALQGDNWDAIVAAIAAGDQTNVENAILAHDQLFLTSAAGKFLDRQAGDRGFRRPINLGLPDDSYRRLAVKATNHRLSQQSLLDVLEVFFGADATRAHVKTSFTEPFFLAEGDTLNFTLDDNQPVAVVFHTADFARPAVAGAVEVAAAVNRALQAAHSSATAVAIPDTATGLNYVAIYSGSAGTGSSIRVNGGRAQSALKFPEDLYASVAHTFSAVTWTITDGSQPGRLRFSPSGFYDFRHLQVGDYVNIYGTPFVVSGLEGSFPIVDISVTYSGSTLIEFFEIENNSGSPDTPVQGTYNQVLFFRPIRRTIYDESRRVIVSQSGPGFNLVLPTTTKAVGRTATKAAYLKVRDSVALTFMQRLEGGRVTAHTAIAHGFTVGQHILVDKVVPKMVIPPVIPGTPSSFVLEGGSPAGDGHFPFVMNRDSTAPIGSSEINDIVFSPGFQFNTVGKTTWKWHFLGECFNLDVGKTVTIRVHKGTVFADPTIVTVSVSAAGPFHVASSAALIPTGPNRYFVSYQTDDTAPPAPTLRGLLVVVEVS